MEESEVPPISQEANEPDVAEDLTDGLAILMANVGELAEEPDTPYAAGGQRREEGSK